MTTITNVEYYKALYNPLLSFKSLKPEQKICVEFSNYLREQTIKKDFPYIWFHVPNEFYRTQSNKGGLFGNILSAMGRIPGVSDYCFIGKNNSFFIEFKTKYGKLSPSQLFFEKWTKDKEIKYYVCRSAREGIEVVERNILIAQTNALNIPSTASTTA